MGYKRTKLTVESIRVSDNILFEKVTDPTFDYHTLQLLGGKLIPVNTGTPNKRWETSDNSVKTLTKTTQQIISVTIDDDIPAKEGSVSFIAKVDNNDTKNRNVTIEFRVNGANIYSETHEIERGEKGRIIVVSTYNTVNRNNGDVFSINMYADKDNEVVIRGDTTITKLRIEKLVNPIG